MQCILLIIQVITAVPFEKELNKDLTAAVAISSDINCHCGQKEISVPSHCYAVHVRRCLKYHAVTVGAAQTYWS